MLTSVLLLILLYSRLRTRKAVCGVIAIGLLANIAYAVSTGTVSFGHLDVRTQVIALATIAVMYFAAKYDYMRIPVTGLRPGMILSIPTVAGFQGLRMPGLPSVTTETTDSRLSEEQVESIRGWGAATPDATHVVVVKHIPFAPFILAGTILYVLLSFAGVFGQ
jgi:hypothetical protein